VVDVFLTVGKWADDATTFLPPQVVVELDEPWDGEHQVTTYAHQLNFPDVEEDRPFFEPAQRVWGEQIEESAMQRRPAPEPKHPVSAMLRVASARCWGCGKKLGTDDEEGLCESCAKTVAVFRDPSGPQFLHQQLNIQPIVDLRSQPLMMPGY
jgi:hypothetical protein